MRKFFSLFAAVLFAGSMLAGVESVDFSAQGYENQQAIESYAGTNFTVTFNKGTNSNAPKYYTSGTAVRCYGANTFTVASESTISQIVLTYGASDGSNEITAAPGTFATDTWTGSANSVVFTIGGTSGNRRIKGIEVTFDGEGGGDQPGGDTTVVPVDTISTDTIVPPVVVPTDTLTCEAAAELAMGGNTDERIIKGYVTEIVSAWSSQYKNVSFWMADVVGGGKKFEAFRVACEAEVDAPAVGDLVWVKGQLKKYGTTPEIEAGGSFGILVKAEVQPTDTTVVPVDTTVTPVTGDVESVDFSAQGYTNQQAIESYSGTNFTVTFDKGTNSNAPKYYTSGTAIRCYGANTFTVASTKTIVKIVLTYGSSDGSNEITATPGAFATDTWTGSANSVLFTIGGTSGNRRIKGMEITFGEGGGVQPVDTTSTDTVPVVPPVVGDTLTCASAAELALAGNTDEYVIKGYVTKYVSEWQEKYKNISFWMADAADGGQVFEAFRVVCETAEEAPVVGDLVWVKGNLAKFNTTPETAAGGSFGILAKAEVVPGDTTSTDTIPVVPPVVSDTLTCASARELALGGNTDEYVIKGYVTMYVSEWQEKYKNISFWMADAVDGGQVFEAFRVVCETAEEAPAVGDLVWVKGNLAKYNTTPETSAGGSFGIIEKSTIPVVDPVNLGEKSIAEFLELKNFKDTCILTGIITNVANNQYGNFDLVELGNAEVKVYVYGLLTAAGETKKCFEEEGLAEGDTLKVKAIYTTYNNAPQAKNAIFVEVKKAGSVTPGAEVEITIADGAFDDEVDYQGYWIVEAQNTDYYISLSNYDLEITQAAGTYTAADLDPEYSYILTETDSISFVSGSIVLAVDAEGVATVTGSLVGNDGNTYKLNIVCPAASEYEYDDDSDFTRNFSSYKIDTEYLSEYGDIFVEASDADGYQITLDLYVPTGASGLVAGTYEINSTYEAGTVAAGIYDSGIYPSFAGIATTEGLTNVWYLVSGTVVVDANLNITVNAVNSLGHTINVTLKASGATGIEETLATGKAVKVLRNGQLLIMKGEKTFDVTGARIR